MTYDEKDTPKIGGKKREPPSFPLASPPGVGNGRVSEHKIFMHE